MLSFVRPIGRKHLSLARQFLVGGGLVSLFATVVVGAFVKMR